MFGLGPGELILIFVAVLLLFGARRLPEIAQGMGKGIREFKKAINSIKEISSTGTLIFLKGFIILASESASSDGELVRVIKNMIETNKTNLSE